jgi:outer membrane immunogenic protein
MKTILFASSAFLLAAVPAFAQDADPAAPPPPATASVDVADGVTFGGPRAEIFGGWDRPHVRVRSTDAAGDRQTERGHRNGGMAGALVGYDLPLGDRLIVGGFGSIAYSTAKTCADGGGCIKAGREIEGGARVGAKVTPNILAYAKGAYVNGQVRDTVGGDGDAHANRDGWRAGAGVEYALNKHAYVKAEYDYTQFRRIRFDEFGGATDPSIRLDRSQVLGGFGVRF